MLPQSSSVYFFAFRTRPAPNPLRIGLSIPNTGVFVSGWHPSPYLSGHVECADEQEAIGKAAKAANGKSVNFGRERIFIVRFPSDES